MVKSIHAQMVRVYLLPLGFVVTCIIKLLLIVLEDTYTVLRRIKPNACHFRDALIASVLDGVRASGNKDVHVKMRFTHRGHRNGPFTVPVDEEVENQHMKFIQQQPRNDTVFLSMCGLVH